MPALIIRVDYEDDVDAENVALRQRLVGAVEETYGDAKDGELGPACKPDDDAEISWEVED